MFRLAACLLSLIVVISSALADDVTTSRLRYAQSMYDYFGHSPFYAIPIFLSGDRASGDTLKIGTYDKYSSRSSCFSKLGSPKLVRSNLANQKDVDSLALAGSGQIAVKKILDAAADAKFDRGARYLLAFKDVKVDETALYDLTKMADLKKCNFLKPIFDGSISDQSIVLINFVVHGRQEFQIQSDKSIGSGASGDLLKTALGRLFGGAKIEARVDSQTQSLITIENEVSVPVAFRPAFVNLDDVAKREKQIKDGLDKVLDTVWRKKDAGYAKDILSKYSDLNLPPDKIIANVLQGNITSFEPTKNERQQNYLRMVVLNILISSLAYNSL